MPTIESENSYATIEEADEYCDARLGAGAWADEEDSDQKARALIDATRDLKMLEYAEEIDVDDVPAWLRDATAELAFQYLVAGSPTLAEHDTSSGIIRKKVDVLETEWAEGFSRPTGLDKYPRVWAFIAPYLSGGGGLEIVRV